MHNPTNVIYSKIFLVVYDLILGGLLAKLEAKEKESYCGILGYFN